MTVNSQSVSALVGILGVLLMLSESLEKTVRDSAREELVLWFKRVGNRSFSDALSSCNTLFVRLFDHIYFRGEYTVSRYVWVWLTGMFIVSGTIVPFSRLIGLSYPSLQSVLALGAITGCVYSLDYYIFVQLFQKRLSLQQLFQRRLSLVWIVAWLLSLIVYSASIFIFNKIHQTPYPASPFSPFAVYLPLVKAPVLLGAFWLRDTPIRVSPFRAMLTSLGAMVVIGLLRWDTVRALMSDINLLGWSIAGYVLLNVCVDSFSLLETRLVLKLASRGSCLRFFGVVILDVLASATIFLAIPVASGNLGTFLDAIVFKGPHPWIGILFWSSFSTSFLFYLYLLSAGVLAGLQAFVRGFLRLDRFLPISEKPFRCLGLVAMVITTLMFVALFCIL